MKRLFALVTALLLATSLSPAAHAADNDLPELGDNASTIVSPEQEYRLGRAWIRKLRGSTPTLNDPVVQDYLERQSYRLAFHSPLENPDLSLIIINDRQINAFAVPGGVIGINAGLMLHAETEAEFSSVLAHELGHLSQRHFARSLADNQRNQWLYLGALLASIAVAAGGDAQGAYALGMTTQAAAIQNRLSYSRQNEQEADRIGMQTLVNAGMDANAMPRFFQRMDRQYRQVGSVPEFILTHPLTQSRIADSISRASQYPKKLADDGLDYQLARVRMLVQFMNDTGRGTAYFEKQLEGSRAPDDKAKINRLGLTLALLRERQFTEARRAIAPLLATEPQRVDVVIAATEIELAERQYAAALALLEPALRLNPESYALRLYSARTMIANEKAEPAIIALEAMTRERRDDPQLWRLLIEAYSARKDAMGIFRARAEVYFLSGNEEKALEQLKLASDQVKNNYPLTARLHKRMREIESSRNDLKL